YPIISQTNENNFLFCSQFSDRPSFRVVELLFRWCVLLWKLYLAAAAYRVSTSANLCVPMNMTGGSQTHPQQRSIAHLW
ncbi:hypothetical protein SFRURICE_021195, partial [Spodoptera frugiperda]